MTTVAHYGDPTVKCINCGNHPNFPVWPPKNYNPNIIYGPNLMNTSDIFTDKERIENIKQSAQEMGLPVSSPEDLNKLYLAPKKTCKTCWGVGILDAFDNELQAMKQIYCKCVKIRRLK